MHRLVLGWVMTWSLAGSARADLKAYVDRPDAAFRWEKRAEMALGSVDCVELKMVSQKWRDVEWKHLLWIARPAEITTTAQAMLIIGGSSWRESYDEPATDARKLTRNRLPLAILAQRAGMVIALVEHVPFQPMFGGKKEDQIIALTFDQYLSTLDPSWPLLLPMAKSAVRAMDTVQQFARAEWSSEIDHFTVTGGSKRGWTTWLTAAVDQRVNGIAPIVIDTLNMGPQMEHQIKSWGKYSEQIEDYTARRIQERMNSPAGRSLTSLVDPYSYREQLLAPKLIIIGTNDRYWPLDALNLYWDGLRGDKYILYVPNNGHGIRDLTRVLSSTIALAHMSAGKLEFPKLNWELSENGSETRMKVISDKPPTSVSAWTASAPTRDFRSAKWTARALSLNDGAYVYDLERPKTGFSAMFGEAVYHLVGDSLYLSTNVRIVAAEE